MSTSLGIAIVAITLALVFYTVGVWSERGAGRLRAWHVVMFWIGLVFDTTGTTVMTQIARSGTAGAVNPVHAATGAIAIALMMFHAVWATVTLASHDERRIKAFHRLSIAVWLIWLVPYVIGMFMGMN